MTVLGKLTTCRHLWMHFIVLVILVAFVNLGKWQLNRLEQKRLFNQQTLAALALPPIILDDNATTELDFHRVQVTGQFDNDATMVLRNQQFKGQSGFSLITPFRLENSQKAILVHRGWVPRRGTDPTTDMLQIYAVTGTITLEGVAHVSQVSSSRFSSVDPPLQPHDPFRVAWFHLNIDQMQRQFNDPLLPIFLDQTAPPSLPNQPPYQTSSIDIDEGSHFSYAMQWFSFAVILAVTYTFFMWHEVKD